MRNNTDSHDVDNVQSAEADQDSVEMEQQDSGIDSVEEVVEPGNALDEISFEELSEPLRAAANSAGWTTLMPVQRKAIPYMLANRDLMVQSRTGSGKTGAFLLPTLERIRPNQKRCQALILVPTRELAQQVAKEAEILGKVVGVQTVAIYGGVKYGPQTDALEKGAQLVIGTPGRVLDHLLRRTFALDDLRILIFDEADRMLSMGFFPDMREVQRYLPQHRVSSYMYSATFPVNVMRLATQFLNEPDFLSLSKDQIHVANAEHVYYTTPAMKKDRALIRLIETENPASAIIFCNTKNMVHYVSVVLQRFGYDADELSSDLGQSAREDVLGRVRKGSLRFLVATDVAARGIDIPELSHVFQYEIPDDPESYVHRAGRTARAGSGGVAVSLIENISERLQLERIAKRYSIDMNERDLPDDEDVAAIVSERVTTLLEAQVRDRDNLKTERMQRFAPMITELTQSEEGQALLAMLIDDFYQQSLHAPQVPLGEMPIKHGDRTKSGSQRRSGSGRSNERRGRSNSRSRSNSSSRSDKKADSSSDSKKRSLRRQRSNQRKNNQG